jgi:hypothetical protein
MCCPATGSATPRVGRIPAVVQVMTLAKSRERAEEVFVCRELRGMTWAAIAEKIGYRSVGAAQLAYNRALARHPRPNGEAIRAGIVERKMHVINVAMTSLAAAAADGDHQAVAALINTLTKADVELAKLFGLSREQIDVHVTQTASELIAETREKLLAVIDAEVIEPKELTR